MNFALNTYFDFQRKTARLEYFIKSILINAPLIILWALEFLIETGSVEALLKVASPLVTIAVVIAGFSLGIQRLNDLNKSRWYILLALIPLINLLFALYLLFAPGKEVSLMNVEENTPESNPEGQPSENNQETSL